MGSQQKNIADNIENVLGLENNTNNESKDNNEESKDNNTSSSEENFTGENKEENVEKKEESTTETKDTNNTVTLTTEQVKINSEMAKVDKEIEDLEKDNSVDTDKFYDTLNEILTDEEQQLEHDNKSDYLKLIEKKKQEYIDSNSKDTQIATKKEEKENLQNIYDRQAGMVIVTAKYPDFDFKKTMDYFENKLNKEQQKKVFDGAKSYADVYENTYKIMAGDKEPVIKSKEVPQIPDVNNTRKEPVSNEVVKDGYKNYDEELQAALGL
jgi:hypothetical protein